MLALASQQLPCEQIKAAAERNFEIASEIQWRKLQLRTQSEQLQLDNETRECTFRPRRIAKSLNAQPRYLLPPSASEPSNDRVEAVEARQKSAAQVNKKSAKHIHLETGKLSVFERLYHQQRRQNIATGDRCHQHSQKEFSAEQLAAFVARQTQDEVNRRVRSKIRAACANLVRVH